MKIATKLRLLSMKNNLKGDVAKLILNNVDEETNISIMRFMKDITNNGCAYSYLKGLQYHNEVEEFYKKHKMDIELVVFLWETERHEKVRIAGNINSEYAWFVVEQVVLELMREINIR